MALSEDDITMSQFLTTLEDEFELKDINVDDVLGDFDGLPDLATVDFMDFAGYDLASEILFDDIKMEPENKVEVGIFFFLVRI